MVTKGIITSIDFNGNTCQVRIPFFETAGNDPIIGTAIVSNTPGSYNGYKAGDVVLVAFEDGQMETPVVIGKLYLGAEKEKADPRGSLNTESLVAAKTAAVPADTKLTTDTDKNLPNTMNPYANLSSIANNLNKLNTDVNYLDVFTNNQFSSVITDVNKQGNELRSEIKQTAENIENKVVHKHKDGSQDALGWNLDEKEWKINAQDTVTDENGETKVKDINIVTIDRSGMSIAGDLKLNGYPKNIVVRYAQTSSDTKYPNLYNFKPDSFPGTEIDKTWYYNKYIKITEANKEKYILISSENIDDYTITPGETVAYVYNLEEINTEWKTETPARVDGQYIWQWTHTESFSFNGDSWDEKDDDKVVCITGAQGKKGDTGVAINNTKQWYILWPASATNKPSKPNNNTEPTEPATPSTVEKWMSTPPEAVNGYVVWTCYGAIFSDDTAENRHIEYSDPVKDNAYALAQGKTTNYYSDTDPADVYSVKKGDCWFKTISSTNDEYNNEMPDQNQGKLYQCSGFDTNGKAIWEDVGGELVTNKLTANYINALDITAKKITVLNNNNAAQSDSNPILFEADGLSETGSVKIANFTVKNDKLYSGEHDEIGSTKAGIYLGSNGLSIGSSFKITTDNTGSTPTVAIAGYTKSVEKKYCIVNFAVVTADNKPNWWDDWNNGNWSDTPPNREDGNYIWEWTKTTSTADANTDDNIKYTKVCITGAKGDKGDPGSPGGQGAQGIGISECKTYYSLSNTISSTGPETGDSNIVATPAINKWSTSPQAFDKTKYQGYEYWTVERRVYTNSTVVWGTPVKASMLSVDFIDSLGITAKKITVLDKNNNNKPLFEADGINGNGNVSIANFTVKNDKLYSGEHDTIDSTKAGIYLGSNGLSIGSNFRITTDSVIISDYTKSITKKYSITDFDTVPNPAPEWWENWNSTNWKTTPPSREDKKYIWEWTKEVKGNGNETNLRVCITGAKGDPGKDGTDGLIPSIGENENWWIGDKDTGIKAEGTDGRTPVITIGENGNWLIDGVDTGVLAKGTPGDPGKTGRSVLSVTKFYKRTTSKPNPPNVKEPTDWYTSPPSFVKGNNYYESDRTIYDSVDSAGNDYSWSDVIENSMLTIDFINSLGITAQGLKVVDGSNNTILSANIANETPNSVQIGGFTVDSNRLYAGTPGTGSGIELSSYSAGLIAYSSNNQGKVSTYAVSKITVNKATDLLTVYIRSYAESDYDYTIISKPNTQTYPTDYASGYAKEHTHANQKSGSTLADYTKVEYHGLKQNDWIYVVYRKDRSNDVGADTGYFLIPETADVSISNVGDYYFVRDSAFDIKGASINVGANFSVDNTGAIKSTSGTIGNLSIAEDGLAYNGSSTSYFKIGSEATENPMMPIYSIFAKVQRIDDCIMGFRDNSDGSTQWAEFKPDGYYTYYADNSITGAKMTGKIPYNGLKSICWLNRGPGQEYTGSSATCPQIIVFEKTVRTNNVETLNFSSYGINKIIGVQITEKRTAANSGYNSHGFTIDADEKQIYIYNGTTKEKTYSVLVIAV